MSMVAAAVSVVAQVELPDAAEMHLSSYICAGDVLQGECGRGNALAKLSADGDRDLVRLEDVPQVVIDAVIAAEDRAFFEHDGIDPLGIGRALYHDLRGGGLSQGGSTITQQFVKNTYLESERTLDRKIKEAVLAIKVEQRMSKEEILEGYLNTIYWGRNTLGIQAASRAYFDKDVNDIGLAEASYLAALIRAPSLADAGDPAQVDEATRRRTTVLDAMLEEGYIDQAERDMVDAMDFSYVVPKESYRLTTTYWGGQGDEADYGTDYVADYVQRRARSILVNEMGYSEEGAEQEIAGGGLRIYTTLDTQMQAMAYDAVFRNVLVNPETDPSAGLVAIDDQGFVRAMVGGRDYATNQNNMAVMNSDGRQVGSTFKPIALAAALKAGYSLERSSLPAPAEAQFDALASPEEGVSGCDAWTAHNYSSEDAETGTLNLVEATAESSNTAYARLMWELGPQAVVDMAAELGMNRDPGRCLPTVLGSGGSSALEMAEVYSTFANRGVHREPTIITRIEKVNQDGDTSTLWQWTPQETNVLSQTQADLVTYSLQQVIDHGTGTGANIGKPAAGKTGTTSNNRDAMFVGYVPRLTAAVWMGYSEPIVIEGCDPNLPLDPEDPATCAEQIPPMRDLYGHSTITGGSLPAQTWATFMQSATAAMDDTFAETTPEQRRVGEPLLEEFGGGDRNTTSTTQPGPGNDGDDGRPGNGNGGPQSTTTTPPITTEPPEPGFPTTSTTTSTSTSIPGPPDDPP